MRRIGLLLLLAAAACDRTPPAKSQPNDVGASAKSPATDDPEALPPTGITHIQKDHDRVGRLIAEWEEKVEAGKPVERRLVEQAVSLVDKLIIAAEIGAREDNYQSTHMRRARMITKSSKLRQDWREALAEIAAMKKMLEDDAKGVAPIPEGFTEPEIKDRLGDWQEKARKAKEALDEHLAELKEVEDALRGSKGDLPQPEETLFTREVEDLKALKRRAEELLAKVQ